MRLITRLGRASDHTILLVILCLASGCASGAHRSEDALLHSGAIERRCGPPAGYRQVAVRISSPSHGRDNANQSPIVPAARGFSPQALEIADIIDARDLAAQVPSLEVEATRHVEGATMRLLQVRQQLSDRILLALLDVKSAAAEADCEEERADQLADRLQEMREGRTRRLTIFALLGSGVGSILSGGLALAAQGTAAGIAGIATGTTESSFGSMALFDDIQHEFQHGRNLLKEIWEAPEEPRLIPQSVWRFLQRPVREEQTSRSLRETLIVRWRQDGRLGEPGSETERRRIALFFGDGGTYEIEDLRARAAMLDLLEADVNLMSHDLERLMQEILGQEIAPSGSFP